MNSIWTDSITLPIFPRLKEDTKKDVLIIGGGMAGIICAYILEQAGVNYALVEADTICSGITKNTTAKITSQHGLIYSKLINEFGIEKAKMYLDANEQALKIYSDICKDIDCDFEILDSYVYSINNEEDLYNEINALKKLNYEAEYVQKLTLPLYTKGAVRFNNQAQFNPLRFIASIASGLNIYEHTKVIELAENMVVTDFGKIYAENIIVATHFPINNKYGGYFVKMYQNRSYVIGLENAQNIDGMYVDESEKGMSFRNYKDILLLGGGSHRTGKDGGNWRGLVEAANKYYPGAIERYRWATQDCMTLDKVPYIGRYSKRMHNYYVISGFNKWGMTSSMVSASIITDMILGKRNENSEVFLPQRSILRHQLLVNMMEATINLLSFSKKRCPHLGCALRWNNEERTWDCPCHGSRFTEDGELIDNPATDDLNKR